MDYAELAEEFLQYTHQFQKGHHQKRIDGIMRGETFVVIYIARKGRCVLPSEISTEMNISSARIAATLNSLDKKGLITRQIDVDDRRRILVDLTPAGKELAERHRQTALSTTIRMLESLGEKDAKELVRIMEKLSHMAPEIMRNK
ncbi:MarR family winged helix-turn-helix transcriptional regulator [Aminipila terrae]|uniref:Winged helix DNA-binding protein n=1 Tax=Aminipila terrae TaxID=2697030 RepID=A0A6P1MHA8_9FIRM|nr:transcriptional regulator [Aminipila terrae]QHI70976.1 winged helix DNA-binding protein [Aminipila terrae]